MNQVQFELIKKYFSSMSSYDIIKLNNYLLTDFNYLYLFPMFNNNETDKLTFGLVFSNQDKDTTNLAFDDLNRGFVNSYVFGEISKNNDGTFNDEVYKVLTSQFGTLPVPEDRDAYLYKNNIKLIDLPLYRDQFKLVDQKLNRLMEGLRDYYGSTDKFSYVNNAYGSKFYEINGLKTYEVHNVDHDSDESFLMEYYEYMNSPLCVCTKYADRSDHDIKIYNKAVFESFMEVIEKLVYEGEEEDDNDEHSYITAESTEDFTNGYGNTFIHEGEVYFTVDTPFWAYGYKRLSNLAYYSDIKDFSSVNMQKVDIINIRAIDESKYKDSNNTEVLINLNGTEKYVHCRTIFFKARNNAPIL